MSIMDSISNAMQSGSQSAGAMNAISQLMNQGGGIQGLISKFQNHGLGSIVQSWIEKGPNLPVQPDQLRSVLGEEQVNQMSQSTGLPANDLLSQLAKYLPMVIDKLTPDGQVQPDKFSGNSLLSLGKTLFH